VELDIWTEKYRPKGFDEVLGQDDIVKRIRAFVEKKNMPHLLFSGPAGTGKTSLALVICRELFGESWHGNLLELNASDERGIDVVRTRVKDFARTHALDSKVPFKVIYLDESDALTRDAQHALRRTIEDNARTCRFILSCNYSSKIIDPIQSRCAVFRFRPVETSVMLTIARNVAEKEGLELSGGAADALVAVAEGDARRLHNLLQSCAVVSRTITERLVYELASMARPQEIDTVLELALKGDFTAARKLLLDTMLSYGFSGLDAIKQIQQQALSLKSLDDRGRLRLIEHCGEAEFRLSEGADEFVQLEALLAFVALLRK